MTAVLDAASITTIGFDGDDTLWHNESLFQDVEARFIELLGKTLERAGVRDRLLQTERRNLEFYGYGAKGFGLSLIETAIEVTAGAVTNDQIGRILEMTRELLNGRRPLIDSAGQTVELLSGAYELALITKGDTAEQRSKIDQSGLSGVFRTIEILPEKTPAVYREFLARHDVGPREFLMVGNSLRSDILPVLEIGAQAVHVPYHVTWAHEAVAHHQLPGAAYLEIESISQLPNALGLQRGVDDSEPG